MNRNHFLREKQVALGDQRKEYKLLNVSYLDSDLVSRPVILRLWVSVSLYILKN